MPDLLDRVEAHLLRAGVSPRHVGRYLGELRDHVEDLAETLLPEAGNREAARRQALLRLGSLEGLVLPLVLDRRFHSRAARRPWLAFFVLPVLAWLGMVGLVLAGLVLGFGSESALRAGLIGLSGPLEALAAGALAVAMPLALAAAIAVAALRRRMRAVWPMAGLAALGGLALMARIEISLPQAEGAAGLVGIGMAAPGAAPLLLVAGLLALVFVLLRRAEARLAE